MALLVLPFLKRLSLEMALLAVTLKESAPELALDPGSPPALESPLVLLDLGPHAVPQPRPRPWLPSRPSLEEGGREEEGLEGQ